ncbi:MAG: futalosine hydrolase [Ferruginibacter sp.]
MQILVIAATEAEIKPFINTNPQIDVLITGVAVPATMYHLHKRIQQLDYDLIIQAGIAGSFNPALALGKTVAVKQDCFADAGMEENDNYTPIFETEFADSNEFPFDNGWLIKIHEYLKTSDLIQVKARTVNKISDSELQKQQYIKAFNADIETMEGAALHYVCLQEKIPFLQIRSVSNFVGERDKTKWKLKEAIENLNSELQKLITELTTA